MPEHGLPPGDQIQHKLVTGIIGVKPKDCDLGADSGLGAAASVPYARSRGVWRVGGDRSYGHC